MYKQLSKRNFILKKLKGFTLVETMVAFLCAVVVIIGTVATLTVSTKYANLEKAETVAQNIAKNVMTQKIKNNKFDNIKAWLGSTISTTSTIQKSVFNTTNPNDSTAIGLGSSSTLTKDLKLLGNSKCVIKLLALDSTPKKINAQVEVLWGLNSDGSTNNLTRSFEVGSIIYEYNYNDTSTNTRDKLATKIDLSVLPAINTGGTGGTGGTSLLANGLPCTDASQCQSNKCNGNPKTCKP